ncbi:hypothetical protein DRN34_02725 [Thermococci archaeon]|nr:MAG: hypothetical protein DRN34_02725 [Thermococci archaeon]
MGGLLGHHRDDDWSNADLSHKEDEDLFHCKKCNVEFALASDRIKGKKIVCPICRRPLKAWQKRWNP